MFEIKFIFVITNLFQMTIKLSNKLKQIILSIEYEINFVGPKSKRKNL